MTEGALLLRLLQLRPGGGDSTQSGDVGLGLLESLVGFGFFFLPLFFPFLCLQDDVDFISVRAAENSAVFGEDFQSFRARTAGYNRGFRAVVIVDRLRVNVLCQLKNRFPK